MTVACVSAGKIKKRSRGFQTRDVHSKIFCCLPSAFRFVTRPARPDEGKTKIQMMKRTLSTDMKQTILAMVSTGCTRESACRVVEIAPATLERALTTDPTFAQQLECAEREALLLFETRVLDRQEESSIFNLAKEGKAIS